MTNLVQGATKGRPEELVSGDKGISDSELMGIGK
jgi:hypothetical protein